MGNLEMGACCCVAREKKTLSTEKATIQKKQEPSFSIKEISKKISNKKVKREPGYFPS